jgi:hypothetical protein
MSAPDVLKMQDLVDQARSLLPPMEFTVVDPEAELMQIDPTLVDPKDPIPPYICGYTHASYSVPDGWVDVSEHSNQDGPNTLKVDHSVPEKSEGDEVITTRIKSYMVDTQNLTGEYREKVVPVVKPNGPLKPDTTESIVQIVKLARMFEFGELDEKRYDDVVRLLGQCGLQ